MSFRWFKFEMVLVGDGKGWKAAESYSEASFMMEKKTYVKLLCLLYIFSLLLTHTHTHTHTLH